MMTGTGTPFNSVGVYCHCLTASMAAASSSGIDRRTRTSCTRPSGPMVASRMTTPCTRADCAIGGYVGRLVSHFLGRLNRATDAYRRGRRRRGRGRFRHAAGNAADDAADIALDGGHLLGKNPSGLRFDVTGRLNGSG